MTFGRLSAMLVGGLTLAGIAVSVHAQGNYEDYSCQQLWRERNGIYKNAGYCFRTERARSYFGNAGCTTSDASSLPLSADDRAQIAAIVRAERNMGCNEN